MAMSNYSQRISTEPVLRGHSSFVDSLPLPKQIVSLTVESYILLLQYLLFTHPLSLAWFYPPVCILVFILCLFFYFSGMYALVSDLQINLAM